MLPSGNQRLISRPHLATISNKEEDIFLHSLLGGFSNVWVGGKKLYDGHWIWLDGTKFSYKNWAPGEPNNSPNNGAGVGMEDSIVINWKGYRQNAKMEWNDSPANHFHYINGFLCQYRAF